MSSIDETGVVKWIRLAKQSAAPATDSTGFGRFYFLDDGSIYFKNDAGVIFGPLGQGSPAVLFSQTADKTIASTTTPTDLFGTGGGSKTLAAGLLVAGTQIHIEMAGLVSTTGSPNITFAVQLGGTEVAASTAAAIGPGLSGVGWWMKVIITCRTVGATGTVSAGGWVRLGGNEIGVKKAGTTTIDTTGTLAVTAPQTWGTSDAANTITSQVAVLTHLSVTGL